MQAKSHAVGVGDLGSRLPRSFRVVYKPLSKKKVDEGVGLFSSIFVAISQFTMEARKAVRLRIFKRTPFSNPPHL